MVESKMAEFKMAEFKMATIIKLSQNEWVKFFFVQNGWMQDGCHHQAEWEWMIFSQIDLVWVRVLCKMGEYKMAEFKMAAIIKLCEKEWVWVRLN